MLLILAGVALTTLTGQGNIIVNAENAVGKYNNSVASEQQLLNEIEKYFQNYLEEGYTEITEPEIVDSSDIANNPEEHFGGYVTNYEIPEGGDANVGWRIFYADENNIYLIASDYIYTDNGYKMSLLNVANNYNGASDIIEKNNQKLVKWINYAKDYPISSNMNIKAVAFLLDTDIWDEKYRNQEYAEYAIGGSTLELWCAAYKALHMDKYVKWSYNEEGYQIEWSDGTESNSSYWLNDIEDNNDLYYIKSSTDKALFMWMASPAALTSYSVISANYTGTLNLDNYCYSNISGFRPVICLREGVQLEKISATEYRIVE